MGLIATTSIRSIPAVDASPSGPKNVCSAVPGLTPFAGRLRPVGAIGFAIVVVFYPSRSSRGMDNSRPRLPGFTPFAGRLRPVGAVGIVVAGILSTTSTGSRPAVHTLPSGPKNGCSTVPGLTPFAGRLRPVGAIGIVVAGILSTTSTGSRPAVDLSPSGPVHACSAVPGFTPLAGRLRPIRHVGIVVVGILSTTSVGSRPDDDASPSRTGPCLLGCTRVYTLSWQVTPRWGYRNRCCGNALNHIDPFKTGRRCVPFRAEKRLFR